MRFKQLPVIHADDLSALCVSDALFSAKTGRSLQVTEDDLLLFLREAHYREEELTAQIVEDIVADPSDKR